jgi:hypothetical protein
MTDIAPTSDKLICPWQDNGGKENQYLHQKEAKMDSMYNVKETPTRSFTSFEIKRYSLPSNRGLKSHLLLNKGSRTALRPESGFTSTQRMPEQQLGHRYLELP